jgi:ABC-type Fe3+-hydroxamate transport system substrate-binding protein
VRLVSLCPSLTELVFDLGAGDELVGITDYCVHPADRVVDIETVGGTKTPDLARIAELRPDLVLMNDEENRFDDARELEACGVRLHSTMPRDCAETAGMVRSIGAALGREAEAARIAADIEDRAARVRAEAEGLREVTWAYLIWDRPLMTVNADTFANALLAQAGGVNVFGALPERYPEITDQQLAAEDPELVLLCTEPYAFEERHAHDLARRTGLPRERFRIADGEYLSWHGSRTPSGIDYAAGLIAAARSGS